MATKAKTKPLERHYGLRSISAERKSHGGFTWPAGIGTVVTPKKWSPEPECGNGLHVLPWGVGDSGLLNWGEGAIFQVVSYDPAALVMIGTDKGKVPECIIEYEGDCRGAAAFLIEKGAPEPGRIPGGTATAGDRGTASAGDLGTATAGDLGTASAGYRGTATAGYRGTASAGDEGTASAGYRGTATAGDRGTASAGDLGTASAGYRGTATAGYRGTATAGDLGTASAGDEGVLIIARWDGIRLRRVVGVVGENGIQKGVNYHVNDAGVLVEGIHPETLKLRAEEAAAK